MRDSAMSARGAGARPRPARAIDAESRPPRRSQVATPEERAERLTPRELQILQLTADGVPPDAISAALGISTHTIRTHMQNILTKLGVHSKLEAVTTAIRTGKIWLDARSRD